MSNESQKPVYYDGSGILSLPVRPFGNKDLLIKPTNVIIEPTPFPVYPYPIHP